MPGENANVEEEQIWAAAFLCETVFICGKDSYTIHLLLLSHLGFWFNDDYLKLFIS